MRFREKELGTMNCIGAKVREFRLKKGIKQCDFLVMLHLEGMCISATSLIRLEGQDRNAYVQELIVLAKVLNVDINDLIDKDKIKFKHLNSDKK
ncbi:MAG: helix-turn-helix domain-containing protein [Oscillospiraceae bacterium]|nr:helix-turn-helix domain-containing protein [Oscillospiraceae bacterium]